MRSTRWALALSFGGEDAILGAGVQGWERHHEEVVEVEEGVVAAAAVVMIIRLD